MIRFQEGSKPVLFKTMHVLALAVLLVLVVTPVVSLGKPKKPTRNPFTGELLKDEAPPKAVVVITGASTGIGRDTAIEFAKNPLYKVYATMRNVDAADFTEASMSAEQEGAHLENIVVMAMDVTDEASVRSCVEGVLEAEGAIDVVVNNAGYGIAACLEGATVTEAQRLFDVNVWGAVRVLQAVLPSMRKRKSGHVINVSSTSGVRGIPCMEYYTGSKFALEGIADSMRYSLAAYDISITQVNPGPVRTAFTDTFGAVEKGGRGTRPIPGEGRPTAEEPHLSYLTDLTQMVVDRLNHRMQTDEAQGSEDVAKIIVHLAVIKKDTSRLEDVPFSIGTNAASQAVLEAVKKQPTGWGGMYHNLLGSMPKLPTRESHLAQEQGHEEL